MAPVVRIVSTSQTVLLPGDIGIAGVVTLVHHYLLCWLPFH
jgi:hypothetical protein